jgi:hypothetical protein
VPTARIPDSLLTLLPQGRPDFGYLRLGTFYLRSPVSWEEIDAVFGRAGWWTALLPPPTTAAVGFPGDVYLLIPGGSTEVAAALVVPDAPLRDGDGADDLRRLAVYLEDALRES